MQYIGAESYLVSKHVLVLVIVLGFSALTLPLAVTIILGEYQSFRRIPLRTTLSRVYVFQRDEMVM